MNTGGGKTLIGSPDSGASGGDAGSKPGIIAAILKLGLKLESTRVVVDGLVVDHAENPTGN
jgi:uncharacterized protein (TIGR03435 family)